jgi:glycosyltransferase involved in cell wall biosynthesis
MIKETSVIICNKNSIEFLKKSIPKMKKIKFYEIISIDGNSNDGSQNFLKKNNIKVLSDQNKGLTYARHLGSKIAKGKYILFLGPDNFFDKNTINKFFIEFEKNKYDAATTLLKIYNTKTYWDSCLNFYYDYIRKPGFASVIGTPTIFKKEIFTKIKYQTSIEGCDDTIISRDLLKNKFKIGVLKVFCNEVNNNSFYHIYRKFLLYGKSDYNYYCLYKNKISIFKLLYHPLNHFLKLFILMSKFRKFRYIFFILIITIIRYFGFLRLFKLNNKNIN